MRKYNGLPQLAVSALAFAALAAGCASNSATDGNSPLEMPPASVQATTAPAAPGSASTSEGAASAGSGVHVREDAPLRYVVKKGDTLWSISNHFLLDPWQWPEIWYVNDKIRNPHLIYPGDVLSLLYVNGRPVLTADVGTTREMVGNAEHMSPAVRSEGLESAIPAISMEIIRDFLQQVRVVDPEKFRKAPYVVDFLDPQVNAGAGSQAYVKNLYASPHFAYSIVRLGQKFVDPDTDEDLGWEAIPIGDAEVKDFGPVGTVNLVHTVREVRAGDQLMEQEEQSLEAYFYPKAPAAQIEGRILSVLDGVSNIGQYFIVAINRGARDGLQRGDVLRIVQAGRTARDPYGSSTRVQLPDTPAGMVMVFKVMPKVSYALVMSVSRPVRRMDKVVSPLSVH